MLCPHCGIDIPDDAVARHLAQKGGKVKSARKAISSRLNGLKGGKPKGTKQTIESKG